MSPTPEVSERQRKAAHKAWETIRRNRGELANAEAKLGIAGARARSRGAKKWNPSLYPKNWKEIGIEVRKRSKNSDGKEQCECSGECLKHHERCEEINGTWAKYRRRRGSVKVRFTIAHLCHTPNCDDRSHLRAMCEPCHLIYDLRCRQRKMGGEDALRWVLEQRHLSELDSLT